MADRADFGVFIEVGTVRLAKRQRQATRVLVTGEIDTATVDDLRRGLEVAISGARATVTVDMSRVAFMDLSGVRALLDVHRGATARGVDLQLVNPSSAVRHILSRTGADGVLTVFPADGRG